MNRRLALWFCLIALVLGWVVYSRSSPSSPVMASSPATLSASLTPKIEGSKIYFVPIGDFPTEQLQPLVEFYRQKYKLGIAVLNSIPVDPVTRDASRQQLVAENLVASVRSGVAEHSCDQGAILIGFTSEDIYPASMNWQFAFGWRESDAHSAVVSTARLNLLNPGQPADPNVSSVRLREIVTKDLGILYYGLPQSQNAKSVLITKLWELKNSTKLGTTSNLG
jgi:predicted Zn-dependent protease